MLREVAKLLKQEAREVDLVARYGGDEFIVLMPQTGLEGAILVAERVRLKVEQTMSMTISGGVAAAKKDDTPVALLLRGDAPCTAPRWRAATASSATTARPSRRRPTSRPPAFSGWRPDGRRGPGPGSARTTAYVRSSPMSSQE